MMLFLAVASGWSAFAFTLDYATNDFEEWTFTSLVGDTTGTLTFRNTTYALHPVVILVPTDASVAANSMRISAVAATTATVAQTGGVGAGAGRIIVIRRR